MILVPGISRQLVQDFVLGISSIDAVTYIGVSAVLALSAMSAFFIPVRDAIRVDPMVALREE
jgi:hypothetical protein